MSRATSTSTAALLCEPYLLLPDADGVDVAWVTDRLPEQSLLVLAPAALAGELAALSAAELLDAGLADRLPGIRILPAASRRLEALSEDRESELLEPLAAALRAALSSAPVVPREAWRHSLRATELSASGPAGSPGQVYRAVSSGVASGVHPIGPAPSGHARELRVLLTSDHQLGPSAAAAMEQALALAGPFDAVVYAGDFVNIPDRASEWFDDARGSAFFPVMQGRARSLRESGEVCSGAEILQTTPIFAAAGNHEVEGRRAPGMTLAQGFESAIPLSVSDEGLSLSTFEALFPSPTGRRYFASTFGSIRIVVLSATRVWRSERADEDPAHRDETSRYQEASTSLDDALLQRYGSHIVDDLSVGSEQHEWLVQELASPEFVSAGLRLVVMHESPHSIGVNAMPQFSHPVRLEERDADGVLLGVRYDYPVDESILLRDVEPLFDAAGVDLVVGGHSHLWSRFTSPSGVHYLETSHAGGTHGAFHATSGRHRRRPPRLWNAHDVLAQGDPGGLEPVVPSTAVVPKAVAARVERDDELPFVADPDRYVFSVLSVRGSHARVASYVGAVRLPSVPAQLFDEFRVGRSRG